MPPLPMVAETKAPCNSVRAWSADTPYRFRELRGFLAAFTAGLGRRRDASPVPSRLGLAATRAVAYFAAAARRSLSLFLLASFFASRAAVAASAILCFPASHSLRRAQAAQSKSFFTHTVSACWRRAL